MKKKNVKKGIRIVLGIIVILAGLIGLGYVTCNPERGTLKDKVITKPLDETLTVEQVKEDIDYAMKTMRERHPAWLEKDNKNVAKVEKQYEAELASIEEGMTIIEELKMLSRIMHELGDGHTESYVNLEENKYINDFTQLGEGNELLAINGEPIEDIYKRFLEVFSYEREEFARLFLPIMLPAVNRV